MAYFLKCKQEVVNRTEKKTTLVRPGLVQVKWGFSKKVTEDEYEDIITPSPYNNPIVNLDNVCDIDKVSGCANYQGFYSIEGTKRAGIVFRFEKGSVYWYYDTPEARDEQYDEIASNSHLYKSKVVL